MTIAGPRTVADERSETREPVLYRTRLTDAGGIDRPVTLVDLSPNGFMARCDATCAAGDHVALALPRLGRVAAEVRWTLGGRIGCRLSTPIGASDYRTLLNILPHD